jgi:3-isopropylmalate/(R)-2-methylmalate dehydratase small subunit
MEAFTTHTGLVGPLDRVDVDTDQIIPKQFLKRIERTGYGQFLFNDWRTLPDGAPNPDFALNHPEYSGASVLVAGRNFGCGSSREHAPWALSEYGFRAIIAPSFADIFRTNCFQNGLLPVQLTADQVGHVMAAALSGGGYMVTVDLEEQRVSDDSGWHAEFSVDSFRRHCLLNGLDDIALTLQVGDRIQAFEDRRGRVGG